MSKPSTKSRTTLNNPVLITTGDQLRKWRKSFNLTQEQAAQLIGVCPRSLGYYEKGQKKIPAPVSLAIEFARTNFKLARKLTNV